MQWSEIDETLEAALAYAKQLDDATVAGIELLNLLAHAIIVRIVSEYEVRLERAFAARGKKCKDIEVLNYISKTVERQLRSPDLSKITKMLSLFSEKYKEQFHELLKDAAIQADWDNLLRARHFVVHRAGNGMNLTLHEMKRVFSQTQKVVGFAIKALELTELEASHQ